VSINILFCVDGRFWQHVGVAIASLLTHNPQNTFRIVIATADEINEEMADQIKALARRFGNATVEVTQYRALDHREALPTHSHLTFAAYLRLFMTEFLDPSIDKLIYLDSDVLVVSDISELWQMELGEAYVGAALEPYDRAQRDPLGFGPKDPYFNSGVMLINLAKWRAENVIPRFFDFAGLNRDKLHSPDQDVINSVFRGHILNIGYEWNWQALFVRFLPSQLNMSDEQYARLKRSPRLVHYTSGYKPWYYRWEPHYKSFYYQALAKTPWSGYVPPDRNLKNTPKKAVKVLQRMLEWHFPPLARKLRTLRAK
jgi:lipopolysaccharide biosynthesis glycosyltransferase